MVIGLDNPTRALRAGLAYGCHRGVAAKAVVRRGADSVLSRKSGPGLSRRVARKQLKTEAIITARLPHRRMSDEMVPDVTGNILDL